MVSALLSTVPANGRRPRSSCWPHEIEAARRQRLMLARGALDGSPA
jgi:hypothetical protein